MLLVLDIAIVAIIILFTIRGYTSGFVKTAVELLGWIAVVLMASFLANTISSWIYDGLISNSLKSSVEQYISQSGQQGVDEFFNGLPEYLKNVLSAYNINAQSINLSDGAADVSVIVASQLRQPIISIISFFLTVIIFVLGIILVKVLANLCHSVVTRIPIVSGLNRVLGLAAGFVKGAVISLVVVWIISFMVLFAGEFLGLSYEGLSQTYVFNLFNQINPLIKIV